MKVPIWLAIYLRKRNKCRIIAPEWLNIEYLSEKLKEEKTKVNELS